MRVSLDQNRLIIFRFLLNVLICSNLNPLFMRIVIVISGGFAAAIILCSLLFNGLGIEVFPLFTLFLFIAFWVGGVFLLDNILKGDKLIDLDVLKILSLHILKSVSLGLAVSLVIAFFANILSKNNIEYLDFIYTGGAAGLIYGLTMSSKYSIIWAVITFICFGTLFILEKTSWFIGETGILLIVLTNGMITACPSCGAWWSRQFMGEKLLREFIETRTRTERQTFHSYQHGEVGYTDVKVPYTVTRREYKMKYQCKKCHSGWSETVVR